MKLRMKQFFGFFIMSLFLLCVMPAFEAKADDFTEIRTEQDLYNIRNNKSGKYRLMNDLDLTNYLSGSQNGWDSITAFRGTLDGNNHTISGYWSTRDGLFADINGGQVNDLNIVLSDQGIKSGGTTGGLVGHVYGGAVITNVTVTGDAITGFDYVGGIAGLVDNATITSCNVNLGRIEGSSSYIGGIAGSVHNSTVTSCNVNVTRIEGNLNYVGGFAGRIHGSSVVDNCKVTAERVWAKGYDVGGFLGEVMGTSQVRNCTSAVTNVEGDTLNVGGFAGIIYASAVVSDCQASGDAVTSKNIVGGFASLIYDTAKVERSNTTVKTVNATSTTVISHVGGFTGKLYNGTKVEYCYTTSDVNAAHDMAGGFAGIVYDHPEIYNACATGNVNSARDEAGGFVGRLYNTAKLTNVNAMGNVSGRNSVGGIVGYAYDSSVISQASSYGNVSGNSEVGGIAGTTLMYQTIQNAYSRGNVQGNSKTGGLVGSSTISTKIIKSYSASKVDCQNTAGALVGESGSTFEGNNYYDSEKAGISPIVGSGTIKGVTPQAKTTSEMMTQETFEGWDFANIWKIEEGSTYPYFDFCGFTPELNEEYSKMPVVNDAWTTDMRITGTGISGSAIELIFADGTTVTATVGSDGNWYAAVPGSVTLIEGDPLRAAQTEPGKNKSGYASGVVLDSSDDTYISVVKNWTSSSGSNSVIAGDEVEITITISIDNSVTELREVTLDEKLNGKVEFVDGTLEALDALSSEYVSGSHKIVAEFGTLNGGDEVTVTYTVLVKESASAGNDVDSITKVSGKN